MSFEIKDKELAGRIGKLRTKSGTIETPAFFPVVNPFRQKADVSVEKIREIGFTQIITNSYIIKQRLGEEAIERGVHAITGFNGVIMTDSGAYQLLIYGREKVAIDPEEIVLYQDKIGSDIAVIADIPTRDDSTYDEALESVKETLKRAKQVQHIIMDSETLWVLPIQGGVYPDLVRLSALEGSRLEGYGMYAIGSPVTVLEKYEFWKIVEMVAAAKMNLPLDKPVHLFGGGHPLIMPLMVALGIDSFDSASYILYARQGRYITEHGTYRINEMEYLPCECEVCSRYTARELMEMSPRERARLIALHNLHVINREIKRIKTAIREGRLWELIEERARTHPSVREALNATLRYVKWMEKLDTKIRGNARGMFLYDTTSYFRPELLRHREFISQRYAIRHDRVVLIPGDPTDKPYRHSKIFREAKKKGIVNDRDEVLFYLPFFDIVPKDIDQTYPYAQFEMPLSVSSELLEAMLSKMLVIIKKSIASGKKVVVAYCDRLEWSRKEVIERLMSENIEIVKLCKV